ncbi:MAG: hypothetical protein HQM15_05320 [Deltaproteobacteria bacterium]|nr:hypothetical protein [Deltaproteobacteria bacterium]
MKLFRFFVLLLFLSSFSACFQFEEVLELKGGQDSIMHFAMKLPTGGEKDKKNVDKSEKNFEQIKRDFEKQNLSPLKLVGFKANEKDGYVWAGFDFAIPSLKALKVFYENFNLMSANPKDEKKPEPSVKEKEIQNVLAKASFSLKKLSNGNLLFSRTFTPPPSTEKNKKSQKKGKNDKKEEAAISNPEEGLMDIVSFRFELISPTEIVKSNAAQQMGNSLRWQTNIGYLVSQPFKMEAEIKSSLELEKMLSE